LKVKFSQNLLYDSYIILWKKKDSAVDRGGGGISRSWGFFEQITDLLILFHDAHQYWITSIDSF